MKSEEYNEIIDTLCLILTNEQLDEQIYPQANSKVLNLVLDVKLKKLSLGKCEPLKKSCQQLLLSFDKEIMRKLVLVSDDQRSLIDFLIERFIEDSSEANTQKVQILHVILEVIDSLLPYKVRSSVVKDLLLEILSGLDLAQKSYVLTKVIPLYYDKISTEGQEDFLNDLFSLCLDLRNLETLCSIYDTKLFFVNDSCLTLLNAEKFWNFLAECLSSSESFLQKQATYILSKSTEFLFERKIDNIFVNPNIQKYWGDFLILLDVSREKQLHLIEPSLQLLNSVRSLQPMWQNCMYKILLKHSQNSIVYSVASYLLQNCDGNIIKDVALILPAVNKNECSDQSNNMFEHLKSFCLKLDQDQFDFLLDQMLLVSWNPASMWSVCKNLFDDGNSKIVNVTRFEKIIQLIRNLPHVFIRSGCEMWFVKYVLRNFRPKDFNEIFDVTLLIPYRTEEIVFSCNKSKFKLLDSDIDLIMLKNKENHQNAKHAMNILKMLQFPHSEKLHSKSILKVVINLKVCPVKKIEAFLVQALPEELLDCHVNDFIEVVSYLNSQSESHVVNGMILKILEKTDITQPKAFFGFSYISKCFFKYDINPVRDILKSWKSIILTRKIDEKLCNAYINAYFAVYLKNFNNEKTEEIIDMFKVLLQIQGETVIQNIYGKLEQLLSHSENQKLVLNFMDMCCQNLKNYTKYKSFKQISINFISSFYSIQYLKAVKHDFVRFLTISNELVSLYKSYHSLRYYMVRAVNKLVSHKDFKFGYSLHFASLMADLLLQGVIIKKDDRVEYSICKQMHESHVIGCIEEESLCYTYGMTRFLCLETIFIMLLKDKHEDVVDVLVSYLSEKYLEHFKKRYFPDSQIHIHKLRIFQLLLAIWPSIKNQTQLKTKLTHLIINSFQEEIHQNCVRQLMQWLLILILQEDPAGVKLVKKVINVSVKTQPSSVTALIPVLYHVTLFKPELLKDSIAVLLPWTMGAQFKLRVYSQIAIKNLLVKLGNMEASPYEALLTSLNSCIEACTSSFNDTLKTDMTIFESFNPNEDLALQTIFFDIPSLNNVTASEWLDMVSYSHITSYRSLIPYKAPDARFSKFASDFHRSKQSIKLSDLSSIEDCTESSLNLQKKITPWKNTMNLDTFDETINSDFILVASLINKPQNLGGLMRTCEVFGVKQLVLSNAKITTDKEFKSLSMSSENLVDILEVKINDLSDFILKLKEVGYFVVGAEQTSGSSKLNEFKFSKKTAVLLGNEKEGIPPNLIPLLDVCLEIPQFGYVRSLNVHVAGAMFIWEYAKQHLVV